MHKEWWGVLVAKLAWLGMLYVCVTYVALVLLGLAQIHVEQGSKAGQIFQEVAAFDRAVADKRAKLSELTSRQGELSTLIASGRAQLYEVAVAAGVPQDKMATILDGNAIAGVDPAKVDVTKWAAVAAPMRGWVDERANNAAAITALEGQLSGVNDPLDHMKGVVTGDGEDDPLDRVRYTVQTLQDMIPLFPSAIFLPAEVLTLLLTLAMGALGSTLQATRLLVEDVRSGKEGDCGLGCFLFRPFQGMVTACVVYIVFKAGQVTISTGDTESLNPFFVSFVGIISGMYTNEAYQMIGRAARSVLPTADTGEGARWGFGLKAAMTAQDITVEKMAADLGRSEAEVRDWVEEKVPLSETDQTVVAAYLRLRPRMLFTSEAPPVGPATRGGAAEAAAEPAPAPA